MSHWGHALDAAAAEVRDPQAPSRDHDEHDSTTSSCARVREPLGRQTGLEHAGDVHTGARHGRPATSPPTQPRKNKPKTPRRHRFDKRVACRKRCAYAFGGQSSLNPMIQPTRSADNQGHRSSRNLSTHPIDRSLQCPIRPRLLPCRQAGETRLRRPAALGSPHRPTRRYQSVQDQPAMPSGM